jgi:hypothetical protein
LGTQSHCLMIRVTRLLMICILPGQKGYLSESLLPFSVCGTGNAPPSFPPHFSLLYHVILKWILAKASTLLDSSLWDPLEMPFMFVHLKDLWFWLETEKLRNPHTTREARDPDYKASPNKITATTKNLLPTYTGYVINRQNGFILSPVNISNCFKLLRFWWM